MKRKVGALYHETGFEGRLHFRLKWRRGQIFEFAETFLPKVGIIVEVGCGYGLFANLCALASAKRRVLGIDIDKRRIELARKTVGERSNITFERKGFADLDLREIDVIVMIDTFHHFSRKSQEQFLQWAYSNLKEGGLFLLKDVDRRPKWKFYRCVLLDTFNTIREYTLGSSLVYREPADIVRELQDIGFSVSRPNFRVIGTNPHALYICKKPGQ